MTGDLRTRVADIRAQFKHLASGCIAVVSNEPYKDDPRWTPWTRFIQPYLTRVDEMLRDLQAVLDADPDTPTPDAPVDDGLVERLADVLREIGGQIAWSYEDVARKVVVARPWQAEVEAARLRGEATGLREAARRIDVGQPVYAQSFRDLADLRDGAARGETRQP